MTKITNAQVAAIAAFIEAGKAPWITLKDGGVAGVYKNRDEARAAKTGKPVKHESDMGFDLIGDIVDLPSASDVADGMGFKAPTEVEANDADDFAAAKEAEVEVAPLEVKPVPPVAPAPKLAADKPAKEIRHASEAIRPTKLVWQIADDMKAENPAVTRREVLAECDRRGIAFYTARTQYQVWKGMQANETAKNA